jgi:hypothetical protein
MFAFIKHWFGRSGIKDPEAADQKTVKLYIKLHKRFDRVHNSTKLFYAHEDARDIYYQLELIRATANRATNSAINVAFGLPEDYMLDEPLVRTTVLTMQH